MKAVIAALLCVALVAGSDSPPPQDEPTTPAPTPTPETGDASDVFEKTSFEQALIDQVKSEMSLSRAYIETLLRLQHSQLSIQAANMFSAVLEFSGASTNPANPATGEDSESTTDSATESGSDSLVAMLETEEYNPYGSFAPQAGYAQGPMGGLPQTQNNFWSNPMGSFGANPAGANPMGSFGANPMGSFGANPMGSFGANPMGSFGAPGSVPQSQAPSYNLGYGGFPSYGQQSVVQTSEFDGLSTSQKVYKAKLLGAFQLYYAMRMRFYQAVFHTSDVQNAFWTDRLMQLASQAATDPDATELQFLFIKMYRTNLETLKLSLSFQYISHFITWLEDELDVNGSGMEYGDGSPTQDYVMQDQADDLIRDRMFAFSAFNSYAQIDFQTFYFDMYLDSVQNKGSFGEDGSFGENSSFGGSFVEVESTAKPFTDIMATGSLGAGNANIPGFVQVYRFYFLLFQMYSAHSGLTSAYADHASYEMLSDDTASNDAKGHEFKKFGFEMLYGGFANNFRYCSQMEYVSSLYELYLQFAPILAQTFGGSFENGSFGNVQ